MHEEDRTNVFPLTHNALFQKIHYPLLEGNMLVRTTPEIKHFFVLYLKNQHCLYQKEIIQLIIMKVLSKS